MNKRHPRRILENAVEDTAGQIVLSISLKEVSQQKVMIEIKLRSFNYFSS